MSLRLAALNTVLRCVAKPKLRLTATPEAADREFRRMARLFLRAPPFLRHLERPGGLHWISAGPCAPRRVVLYFHGGGYVSGSPRTHEGIMGRLSLLSGVEICAPAYPLAQQAPAPAQFDAALAAWERLRVLCYPPEGIVLAGDSAGGGLALALLAALCAGGERPAGAVLFSPWADLAATGESLRRNRHADPFLPVERLGALIEVVLGPLDARDPRISPLYAEFPGCPPVTVFSSETEILADDARRMARRLRSFGGPVAEDIHSSAPHAWPVFDGWIPEARAALIRAAKAVQASLAATSR